MKYVKHLCLMSALLTMFTTSCSPTQSYLSIDDNGTATIKIFKNNDSNATARYIPPSKVDLKFSYNTLSGTLSNNENVCPSIGDVNILVIPVHTFNSKYNTKQVKDDIYKAFFGDEDDEDLGFYSLSQYYYQSSFEKLNIKGVVTDWFDLESQTNLKNNGEITQGSNGTIISEILTKATDWAIKTQGIDIKDFDQNQDGSIDSIWLVYDHLNYFNQYAMSLKDGIEPNEDDLNSAFWNYSSWDFNTSPDLENPTTSAFSWVSFDSLYSGYATYETFTIGDETQEVANFDNLDDIKIDSHVLIHEHGHQLGLEDFYADNNFRPAGSTTMMDQNIGDLDSYSKMLLGWVTPYVVYGTSQILIPTSDYDDHSVIVIPSNYQQISESVEMAINNNTIDQFRYEFNPFSEYLMIDLYSPTSLNYQDAYGPYLHGREAMSLSTGVRIYHIDSRIFKCQVVNYDGGQALNYVEGYVWDGNRLANDEAILMPISNSKSESINFQLPEEFDDFEQIRLLEKNGTNTFDNGNYADGSTLWMKNSAPFDILNFGYQFFNGRFTYNDGNDLPFKIKVETLKGV